MKNNTKIIVFVAVAVFIVAALFYFGGRNKTSAPAGASAADPMHANAEQNTSLAFLNGLMGKQSPPFSLADRNGNTYSSDSLRGKNVILFFSEGLMCYPACWNQIVALAKDDRFRTADTVVLTVLVDAKEDWQKAIDKMPELAQATVVFDTGAAVSNKFNMLGMPSSMHPGSLPGHTFVLMDKGGIVRYVLDDPQMGIRNDQLAAEVAKLK